MLKELHVSNYALIDNIDVNFYPGLNIITGETGAGKSIMLGALSLILGARADSRTVKKTEKKSIIETVFDVTDNDSLRLLLSEADIDTDDSVCILRREISPGGRSRAFVNDTPVTLSQLHDIALRLIDLHSQHQNQLLTQPDFQRSIIDALADNSDRLLKYEKLFNDYRLALRRLKVAKASLRHTDENADFIRYQLQQLDEFDPQPGEQAELEAERNAQTKANELKSSLVEAIDILSQGTANILSGIDTLAGACSEFDELLNPDDDIPSRLDRIRIDLADIANSLESANEKLYADPAELERIETRLSELYSLQQRYKAESEADLIEMRQRLRSSLDALEEGPEAITRLENEARKARAAAKAAAAEITEARQKAASRFADELRNRAMPLGMKNLCCEVAVEPTDMNITGADNVEFRFAFNKNQPLMPVAGVASGGEISRLMLSIKAIVADKMQLPSIVFDEVDTGVSGEVAARMGNMMRDIADNLQVIVITHLPQVAAKGAHHFKVYKEDDEHATHTRIAELSSEQRVDELALMLGGEQASEAARENALTLLKINHNI